MSNDLERLDQAVIDALRGMARQGRSPAEMVREVKRRLGGETHILTLLSYFRYAFHLSLAEAKPIAALSRNEHREVEDEPLLDELLSPAILNHRSDWEDHKH
ncbi:MAG TPA: hypothetical protein VMS17_03330 [Gemmataceae bacterium]|nr:hypothetical protein [Gemmataceae bacterium]